MQENAAAFRKTTTQYESNTKFSKLNKESNGEYLELIQRVNRGEITSSQDIYRDVLSTSNTDARYVSGIAQWSATEDGFKDLLEMVKEYNTY